MTNLSDWEEILAGHEDDLRACERHAQEAYEEYMESIKRIGQERILVLKAKARVEEARRENLSSK